MTCLEELMRGHTTQLEHFQSFINQLQTSVEYCEAILQRNKSLEILKGHQALIERCRGVLNAEKHNINKPLYTGNHKYTEDITRRHEDMNFIFEW